MKKILIQALEKAGASLLHNFNKTLVITVKENQSSIVTNADIESEKTIIGIIQKAYPCHNIISEEYGYIHNGSEFTWVIDPLDGTSNFAAGIPWFGILIAVLKDSEPILASACLPVQQDIYYAEKGNGSFRNGERIHASANSNLNEILVAFSTDYTGDREYLDKGIKILKRLIAGSRNIRTTNSLIDFLYVAEGKMGACINMYTRLWDIAAPSLLIEEAGGFMTDIAGNELHYKLGKSEYTSNYSVVTGSRGLKESLMACIL
jgi:myo-inositol-1(or 4)-monophosphatase